MDEDNGNGSGLMVKQDGLGAAKDGANSWLFLYIQNRPPLPQFAPGCGVQPLLTGDIAAIAQQTGNHWRKVFNVLAKVLFDWIEHSFDSWQQLRDEQLLQGNDGIVMYFVDGPELLHRAQLNLTETTDACHWLVGEQNGMALSGQNLVWLNEHFAQVPGKSIWTTPYLDYRQFSNIKIEQFLALVRDKER